MRNVGAVIVTIDPTEEFWGKLKGLVGQVDQVAIVDNGSTPELCEQLNRVGEETPNLEIILNHQNKGIATALNQGLARALTKGCTHSFTFDQDSQPASDMIPTMLNVLEARDDAKDLAVIAPAVVNKATGVPGRFIRRTGRFSFERLDCDSGILENVVWAISSGSLLNLKVYEQIGPLRDGFFIDYVDTEYCLRAGEHGYKIIVACKAHLYHHLGNQQQRTISGRSHYPTFHSPLRWYYISRNRVQMIRQYALRHPYWLVHELGVSTKSILRMLVFEDQKPSKLRALLLGTRDGILGNMGQASDRIKALLPNR